MDRTFYRVVAEGFSNKDFSSFAEAKAYIEEHRAGCPSNFHMSDGSRQYWSDEAKGWYIEFVQAHEDATKICYCCGAIEGHVIGCDVAEAIIRDARW